MRSVDLFHFYHLGARIRPISDIVAGMDRQSYLKKRAVNVGFLQAMYEAKDSPLALEECKGLLAAIQLIETAFDTDPSSPINPGEATLVQMLVRDLERALRRNLQTESVFQVEQVGIYRIRDLVEQAEKVFPPSVIPRLQDRVVSDWREAGKCLAFELATASGFHTIRAAESVIHEYYVTVTGDTQMKRKDRNWGAYVRNLNRHKKLNADSKVDAKLTALIDQVREHHRNPVMHPEETLTAEQAYVLFNICQSLIVTLSNEMASLRS